MDSVGLSGKIKVILIPVRRTLLVATLYPYKLNNAHVLNPSVMETPLTAPLPEVSL